MANEYEIKDVGFIGSLWQGEFNTPLLVGKTIEIINVPNTIQNGGKQAIYFTSTSNIDTQKLTNQLPDVGLYYKIDKLSEKEVQNLLISVKLDPEFTRNQQVLYRFNSKFGESNYASSIPIQDNWSFDISDPNNPKYIYNIPESILYCKYIFLVDEKSIPLITDYFLKIQQIETIFEKDIVAFPPTFLTENVGPSASTMPPIPSGINDVQIYKRPILDEDLFAEEAALKQFEIEKERFSVSTINEFNIKLKQLDIESKSLMEILTIQKDVNVVDINLKIRLKLMLMARNYLFEQLRNISSVGTLREEPERYSVAENGDLVILDKRDKISNDIITQSINDEINLKEFDEFIDEIIEDLTVDDNNVYVFKRISKMTDYSMPILRHNTYGLFKYERERLSTYFTGSLLNGLDKYYWSIFNKLENTSDSFHQFDIAYGHISGSGSSYIENGIDMLPAKTMYSKHMMECFGTNVGRFRFKNNVNGNYFYSIQFNRELFKHGLDVGNFELKLSPLMLSGSEVIVNPSSSITYTLIDDSLDSGQKITWNEEPQEYYYVVSGSIRDGIYSEPNDDAWGIVFPKIGLVILDGVVLDQSCSFNTSTGSIDGDNINKFFMSISGSSTLTYGRTQTSSIYARSSETSLTETYFCRAEPNEFNYSSNYTYVTGSNGFLKYDYFKNKSHSYITTIGLYNKQKQLLAIGKLRNPLLKHEGKLYIFQINIRIN